MYSDDDPYLAQLRDVCLAFPESCEVEAWGRPTFRAGKKLFAVFSGTDDRPWGVVFKPEPDERPALLQDRRFYVPAYFGPSGWLALDFGARKRVDWSEVAELMESSYRQVALKRMLKALEERGLRAGPDRPAGCDWTLVNITRIMGVVERRLRRLGTPPIILSSHPPRGGLRPCGASFYGLLCRLQGCVGVEGLQPPRGARRLVFMRWRCGRP